jgi:hypothetical protein
MTPSRKSIHVVQRPNDRGRRALEKSRKIDESRNPVEVQHIRPWELAGHFSSVPTSIIREQL